MQPLACDLDRHLGRHPGRGRARAGRIHEGEGRGVTDPADQIHRLAEIGVRFAREADDEISRQGDIGAGDTDAVDQVEIRLPTVLPVHCPQDPVRPRLNRQMQPRHQRRQRSMGVDQVVRHVVGVAGRVADTIQPRDVRQGVGQPRERRGRAVRSLAIIGIDVLSQQCDLTHTLVGEPAGLGQNGGDRPRPLGPARIGHDAEAAEFVAAFLHGQEGRGALDAAGGGQGVELVDRGEVGPDPFAPRPRRTGQQLGQLVIGLRSDHQIDGRLAPHDLLALGLGDAAGHGDGHGPLPGRRPAVLQFAQLAELGINLLGRLFANMAGVENDEVSILGGARRGIAERPQHIGHALRIIDVHLAAVGLDEQALGRGLSVLRQGEGFSHRRRV